MRFKNQRFKKGDVVYRLDERTPEVEVGVIAKAWPKAAIRVRWPNGEGYFSTPKDWVRLYCRAF